MAKVEFTRPSTWLAYKPKMCNGCWGACCTMPVEVTVQDLIRLGLTNEDEVASSIRKTARRLEKEKVTCSYRAGTGLFTLTQKRNGDCQFLGADRLCTVYASRPDVCRRFPEVGPRPGYCPAKKISAHVTAGKS